MENCTDLAVESYENGGKTVLDGVKVEENGKAAQAGLMAGDCILAVDGAEVASASQVTGLIAEKSVGDSITLTVLRNNQEQSITVTLGEYVPSNS